MLALCIQKAIQECEKEWADNKKLVDLSQKDIRKAVCFFNGKMLLLFNRCCSIKIHVPVHKQKLEMDAD